VASESATLVLNWVPSAEHAPFFFARQRGWFSDAGIALTIDSVAGSPEAVKRAVGEPRTLAVADFIPFLRTRGQTPGAYAVMALQPHSPYAAYYAEGKGIRAPSDLSGKRIAAMEQDPMRTLWQALGKRNGADPARTVWVALSNAQKPDALVAGDIDAAFNPFLHNHLNYQAALGERMRVLWWHELGFTGYGHVLVAGKDMLEAQPEMVRRFVGVTQAAWAQCLARPDPCIDALLGEHPQLDREREVALWSLTVKLRDAGEQSERVLGEFDEARVRQTFQDLNPTARPQDADQAARAVTNFFLVPRPHGGSQATPGLDH
jgi:NitT/TauT family transport system substrate-binding protein